MTIKDLQTFFQKNPCILLSILLIIFYLILQRFMIDGFGEPDSARIGVSIIDMIEHGNTSSLSTYYFSDNIPLYAISLKNIVKLFGNNYCLLPSIINHVNIFFSILNLLAAFIFTKKIFKDNNIAYTTIIFYFFTPGFFISSIYGFPHLISNTFFIFSLYFFVSTLTDSNHIIWKRIITTIFMFLSISFKSDIVLFFGVFFGILFFYEKLNLKNILHLIAQVFISLILFYILRRLLLPDLHGSTTSVHNFKDWLDRFSSLNLNMQSFFNYQIKPVIYTYGAFTNIVLLTVCLLMLIKKKWKIILFFLSWTLVPTLFWILIFGNSARHNFANILPVVILITIYFHNSFNNKGLIAIVFILSVNMIITPANSSTGLPSAKFFKSSALINSKRNNNHKIGEYINSIDSEDIYIFGSYQNPWILYELIKDGDSYSVEALSGIENYSLTIKNKNQQKNYKIFYMYWTVTNLPSEIQKLQQSYKLNTDALYISLIGNIEALSKYEFSVKSISTTSDSHIIIK
ncbi:MAG: hypothetical protein ABIJ40_08695 [Bacteroidota bacterium]|nr:hypothetical protein [bacterium]MBU1875451.1 hypothetical protein [bacterium]